VVSESFIAMLGSAVILDISTNSSKRSASPSIWPVRDSAHARQFTTIRPPAGPHNKASVTPRPFTRFSTIVCCIHLYVSHILCDGHICLEEYLDTTTRSGPGGF